MTEDNHSTTDAKWMSQHVRENHPAAETRLTPEALSWLEEVRASLGKASAGEWAVEAHNVRGDYVKIALTARGEGFAGGYYVVASDNMEMRREQAIKDFKAVVLWKATLPRLLDLVSALAAENERNWDTAIKIAEDEGSDLIVLGLKRAKVAASSAETREPSIEDALAKLQSLDESKGIRVVVTRYVGGATSVGCERFDKSTDSWRSLSNAVSLSQALAAALSEE